MSEQEKKQQRIYGLLNAKTKEKISEITRVYLWPPSSPEHNPVYYAKWDVLENKTNATSYPNIGSLKTAIEEEWNKMSEVFFLKPRESFQRCPNKITEKMAAILRKFTAFSLSFYFVVHCF